MELREIGPEDMLRVSVLLHTAFGGAYEARLVEALRESNDMALELVAEDGERLLGYIAFSSLVLPENWWAMAPVAVSPARQRKGVGSELIRYGLDHARRAGAKAVVVLGDTSYYRRFGFTLKAAENLTTKISDNNTMVYPIAANTAGTRSPLTYPKPFFA
ncbi:GNAT family N-acetyltransferase [Pseudooceanicola sp. C21-150M6]|uniref:GNAT family N-acetyltransferase n=1 Tax=Pseudooceanicola sp. C21-150M6 TaxID=3434355 RepID=UPI003D7F650E